MKRMILILMLISCIGTILQAKNTQTGWDLQDLKGHVKSCEKVVKANGYKTLMTFDANGNEISFITFDYDTAKNAYVVSFTRTIKYDADNKVLEKQETGYGESATITCKYNEKNQLIEERNTGDKSITKYSYTLQGNQVEKLVYSSDSKTPVKTISIFDTAGDIIECDQYNSDGEVEWKDFYQYNAQGQKIGLSRTATLTDLDVYTDEEYTYIDTTSTQKTEYNEQGFVSRQETENKGIFTACYTYTYSYTFDQVGNWTKKTTFFEGEEPTSETQIIEYY